MSDERLDVAIKQYALDLRRNASGGDDCPAELAKGVADYLEILIKRSKGDCTCAQAGFPDSCDNCDAQGWRDMSTAPRDGTYFLWCVDNGEYTRKRISYCVIRWPEYDVCFEVGWWHPLPTAPSFVPVGTGKQP